MQNLHCRCPGEKSFPINGKGYFFFIFSSVSCHLFDFNTRVIRIFIYDHFYDGRTVVYMLCDITKSIEVFGRQRLELGDLSTIQ